MRERSIEILQCERPRTLRALWSEACCIVGRFGFVTEESRPRRERLGDVVDERTDPGRARAARRPDRPQLERALFELLEEGDEPSALELVLHDVLRRLGDPEVGERDRPLHEGPVGAERSVESEGQWTARSAERARLGERA